MAAPRTTSTNNPAPADHWNSGSLGQRALWALFEQATHGAGNKAGKQLAKQLGDQVFHGMGGSDNNLFTGGAMIAAQTFLNADLIGKLIANKFNLPADKVVEISNEGLDEFIRGLFDSARTIDPALPVDQQNAQLRQYADRQLEAYIQKVARQNPQILREVILVQDHGTDVVHEMDCSFERPRLDAHTNGVRKVRWIDVPASALPAACACRKAITFKGRLNDVLAHLRANGVASAAEAERFMAELRLDANKDVRAQVFARANTYDQVTVDMVRSVLREPHAAMRRELLLALVGIQPKSGAESVAAGALAQGKKAIKQLADPNSPIRKAFDTGVATYVDNSKKRRRAMNGKA